MTRVAFGVSALSFAANMSVRQNALDLAHEFPLAAKVVEDCFSCLHLLLLAHDADENATRHQLVVGE